MKIHRLRAAVYLAIEPQPNRQLNGRIIDIALISLIILNVVALMLESVPEVRAQWANQLVLFELISVIIFAIEYALRVWVCVEDPSFAHSVKGRIRYIFTPHAIIDLIAILPFFIPFFGWDLRFVRTLRILRLARVAKLARYTTAVSKIKSVILAQRDELIASVSFMALLIIISSCLLYYAEHEAQPKAFQSIPATMWWSIVTLTTVGYGDIYPITIYGKVIAAIIALLGIGMVALPTSILGAGFIEESRSSRSFDAEACPNCGQSKKDQVE